MHPDENKNVIIFQIILDNGYYIYKVYINFINCITWFNPAYFDAACRSKINSLFFFFSSFLPLFFPSFGTNLSLSHFLI